MGVTFGLALDFGSQTRPLAAQARRQADLARFAEDHGFESVWAGESYFAGAFHLPSPMLLLSYLAPRTRLRLGTGVTLLPAWNPLKLAYDAAVLDNISDGRLVLGVGLGSPALQQRFGHDPATIGQWMDDSVQALKALFAGQSRFAGSQVDIQGGIAPLPLQPGGPPLWIGGGVRRSAERAAQFGDGYYASTNYGLDRIGVQAERYRSALSRAGKDPASGAVSANRLTLVAPDSAQARDGGRRFLSGIIKTYARMGSWGEDRKAASSEDLFDQLASQLCLVGSPEEVTEQVRIYQAAGVTHIQARLSPDDMPEELARQTIRLMGAEVIPAFAR